MRYSAEQAKAIKNLFEAMVESISATPDFEGYINTLHTVGLGLAEASLDLTIVPLDDDGVSQQSDADWLKSMHIAPDLAVADSGSGHQERP